MDVIKSMLSILVSLFFLSIVFRLAWPILVFIALIILFTVLRGAFAMRRFRNSASSGQSQSANQQQNSGPSFSSSNPNVIDAEFTEEELD